MPKNSNEKGKKVSPIKQYTDVDDDEESVFGASVFRDTLGISVDEVTDEDQKEEPKNTF